MSSTASGSAAAPAQTAQPTQRTCFNTFCKEPTKADGRRRGWRLRSGDFAELCERCLCTYEQGSFCETFHNEVAGWRNCEACGKKVHCGCIVSVHAYVLLDGGGVDCIACARKYFGSVSNQMWMTSSLHQHPHPHNTNPRFQPMRPPPSPFPGQWRQAGSLWNTSSAQSDLQQRLAFEFDRPSSSEKFLHQVRASNSAMHHQSHDKKFDELHDRPGPPAGIGPVMRERFVNGPGAPPPGLDPANPYSIYHTNSTNPNPSSSNPNPNSNSEMDHVSVYGPRTGEEQMRYGGPGLAGNSPNKGFFGPSQPVEGSEMRGNGGRPRLDGRNRAQQLLPRYWPRITDQELQQINGDSNSVITPLFEKMLSASDAGRIGRLVLPKKCAEAYFPAIHTPEGLPLTVQDANGKNWTFQFRFWPNNNSRMYVLEGITPCIQALQLQAGDTVTFSRIDPEGKLVMGFRKAAPVNGEPEIQHLKSGSGFLTSPHPDNLNINTNINHNHNNNNNNNNNNTPKLDTKDPSIHPNQSDHKVPSSNHHHPAGPAPLFPSRRKPNNNLPTGKISKRLRIENEDSMELKVTWEEAQSLLRPPPSCVPNVTVVDGHEFEEYEEPPVLGRRTYFVTNHAGETHQWAQCCECMRWRKIPTDALLTAKWTCSENVWDSERSSCSCPAELTLEQLVQLMPTRAGGGTKKELKIEPPSDPSTIDSSEGGLDTLANLAILEQSSGSAAAPTTRHPRHRPGCSCIVCIQPPSGKGPKHKASCVCNVCITVRRRFRTLMMRKERRISERELEEGLGGMTNQGVTLGGMTDGGLVGEVKVITGSLIGGEFGPVPGPSCSDDVKNNSTVPSTSSSPMKTQIDLNIQPEKEEDNSPKSVDELAATSAIKLLQEAAAAPPAPAST